MRLLDAKKREGSEVYLSRDVIRERTPKGFLRSPRDRYKFIFRSDDPNLPPLASLDLLEETGSPSQHLASSAFRIWDTWSNGNRLPGIAIRQGLGNKVNNHRIFYCVYLCAGE
jgi:hypothetical protein